MAFKDILEKIEAKYEELGLKEENLGWRFLYGNRSTLEKNNGILLITMNPGGEKAGRNQGVECCDEHHAILDEVWPNNKENAPEKDESGIKTKAGKSHLQLQFKKMYATICNYPDNERDEVIKKSLGGYFIPFRSRSWKKFPKDKKKEAISFARDIWKRILSKTNAQLIICIDIITFRNIKSILEELDYEMTEFERAEIKWDKVTYEKAIYKSSKSERKLVLVRFPHLSTYKIFSREPSKEVAKKVLQGTWEEPK